MTYIPIRALSHGVFSYGCRNREILVLKAFFDDSGTHDASDVIVMGGMIAPEEVWSALEPKWQAEVDRLGIKEMHMSHCEGPWKDFKDFDRNERNAIIAFFSDLICETRGRMLASAVSRKVWESVTSQTRLGEVFSEPIDFLFNICMRRALESRRATSTEPEEVVVTFATRDQNLHFWEDLAANYEKRWPSRLVGYAFGRTAKSPPLQAADMIAYEAFVHQCQFERTGENFSHRPNMVKLMNCLAVWAGFYNEQNLLEYARNLIG